jgi:hypothetical protein
LKPQELKKVEAAGGDDFVNDRDKALDGRQGFKRIQILKIKLKITLYFFKKSVLSISCVQFLAAT